MLLQEVSLKAEEWKAMSFGVLVRLPIAMGDTMTTITLIEEKRLTGSCLQFIGLVHCHRGRKHGGMKTDMALER